MGRKNKRRRDQLELTDRRTIHPNNKYWENPPDFSLLASLYPSFPAYVSCSNNGQPKIDWTDFNATRELTRVLLLHDHSVQWWFLMDNFALPCPADQTTSTGLKIF